MDTPIEFINPLPQASISSIDQQCPLKDGFEAQGGPAAWVSNAWPAANRGLYIPFDLQVPFIVKQIAWYNAATVAGNVDAGIYDIFGNKIISTGSTAMAGASALQIVDITDTELNPANYYMAMVSDSGTATFFSKLSSGYRVAMRINGQQEQSAFPLANPATFSNPTGGYCPVLILTGMTVI